MLLVLVQSAFHPGWELHHEQTPKQLQQIRIEGRQVNCMGTTQQTMWMLFRHNLSENTIRAELRTWVM